MSDTYGACSIPKTRVFMDELLRLCQKHGMALVPTYEGEISFHDSMQCIPFDQNCKRFIMESSVDVNDFDPPLELIRA